MKKFFSSLIVILLLVNFLTPVYASENASERKNNLEKIKNYPFKCNVTYYLIDETNEYPGEVIKAVMVDKTGTITDNYSFSKSNSWGGNHNPKYTVLAPAVYTVTFEGLEKGYSIVNTLDRTNEITFEAISDETADCYWSIIKESSETEENVIKEKKKNLKDKSSVLFSVNNQNEQNEQVVVKEEDATKIYEDFLSDVSYIKENKEWENSLLIQYKMFEKTYIGWYENFVDGGTKEAFLSMNLFERFIWAETYLRFAWAVNTGDFNTYFGNEENFKTHITSNIVNIIRNAKDYEKVEKAYLKLADWQYTYIKENGVPFNFINNKTYLDEVKEGHNSLDRIQEKPSKETPETNVTIAEIDDIKEIAKVASELLKDADEKTKKEATPKKGIWDDVIGLFAENILTILIIVILSVIVVLIIWKKKRLNVDETNENHGK